MTCIQAMVQGLPFPWVGGSGSEMANRLPTTPTPRSPYLPSASGQAFGDKPDPGVVFFSFGRRGRGGTCMRGWVPGYVLEILGYKEQYVTRLLFGYQKSKVRVRTSDESG